MSKDSSANVIKALKINDLQKRIAEIEAEIKRLQGEFRLIESTLKIRDAYIADLERQNELLRAVADEAHEYIKYEPISLIPDKYWRLRREAIDGGALEEGE